MIEIKIVTDEKTGSKYLCIKEQLLPDTETRYRLDEATIRALKDEALKALGEL